MTEGELKGWIWYLDMSLNPKIGTKSQTKIEGHLGTLVFTGDAIKDAKSP